MLKTLFRLAMLGLLVYAGRKALQRWVEGPDPAPKPGVDPFRSPAPSWTPAPPPPGETGRDAHEGPGRTVPGNAAAPINAASPAKKAPAAKKAQAAEKAPAAKKSAPAKKAPASKKAPPGTAPTQ